MGGSPHEVFGEGTRGGGGGIWEEDASAGLDEVSVAGREGREAGDEGREASCGDQDELVAGSAEVSEAVKGAGGDYRDVARRGGEHAEERVGGRGGTVAEVARAEEGRRRGRRTVKR